MKAHTKKNILLHLLIASLNLMFVRWTSAQTFTNLHTFSQPLAGDTNYDGNNPAARLILSSNVLYGTAEFAGYWSSGTVFKLNTDGTHFTNLYSFTAVTGDYYTGTNCDGAHPRAELVLFGNTLYGTARTGGNGAGTVFAINTDGSDFTNLHSFSAATSMYSTTNSDGAAPNAGLHLSGSTLYGTAAGGGSSGNGALFAINTDGTGFTNLYSFTGGSDGSNPHAGLILSGYTLYGTANTGGSYGKGTVFAINTDGTGFTNLYSFTGGSDGAYPLSSRLVLSGNTLYGTTVSGGSYGNGTIFAINTDGSSFTNVYSFTAGSDGATPLAELVLSGSTLYGTAYDGGSSGNGTVFAVNTNGSGFTTLYSFTALSGGEINGDGANPEAGLVLSGNILYGTTYEAGSGYHGTVFSLMLPLPQLTLSLSGTSVILTWPTNTIGFTLESSTNLNLPIFWTTVSPTPIDINTNNVVTNFLSGTQMFYRLSQ